MWIDIMVVNKYLYPSLGSLRSYATQMREYGRRWYQQFLVRGVSFQWNIKIRIKRLSRATLEFKLKVFLLVLLRQSCQHRPRLPLLVYWCNTWIFRRRHHHLQFMPYSKFLSLLLLPKKGFFISLDGISPSLWLFLLPYFDLSSMC